MCGVVRAGFGGALTNRYVTDAGHAALGLRVLGAHPRLIFYTPSITDQRAVDGAQEEGPALPAWLMPGLSWPTRGLLALLAVASRVYERRAAEVVMLGRLPHQSLWAVDPADTIVTGALDAVETAAVVINAQSGIEMITSRMMEWAAHRKLCRLIVINKIDAGNADPQAVLAAMKLRPSKRVGAADDGEVGEHEVGAGGFGVAGAGGEVVGLELVVVVEERHPLPRRHVERSRASRRRPLARAGDRDAHLVGGEGLAGDGADGAGEHVGPLGDGGDDDGDGHAETTLNGPRTPALWLAAARSAVFTRLDGGPEEAKSAPRATSPPHPTAS